MMGCASLQGDIDSASPRRPAPSSMPCWLASSPSSPPSVSQTTTFSAPRSAIRAAGFQGQDVEDAWSSCGSCHPDGLADSVTWFFGTGPRQTIPLDWMFSKQNPGDQRVLNWSAVRGSNTDFNANSRATQGGCGFASDNFAPGQCFAKGPLPWRTRRSTTTASFRGQ